VNVRPGILAALCAAALCAGHGAAAADRALGSYKHWSAMRFGSGDALACMAFTQPMKSEGDYTRRGDAFVFVTRRPDNRDAARVSVEAGYTYAPGSRVRLVVGDLEESLHTEGSTAWLDGDGVRLIRAMRAGRELVVTGTSDRGTETVDRYSLYGFTAAHEATGKACRGR